MPAPPVVDDVDPGDPVVGSVGGGGGPVPPAAEAARRSSRGRLLLIGAIVVVVGAVVAAVIVLGSGHKKKADTLVADKTGTTTTVSPSPTTSQPSTTDQTDTTVAPSTTEAPTTTATPTTTVPTGPGGCAPWESFLTGTGPGPSPSGVYLWSDAKGLHLYTAEPHTTEIGIIIHGGAADLTSSGGVTGTGMNKTGAVIMQFLGGPGREVTIVADCHVTRIEVDSLAPTPVKLGAQALTTANGVSTSSEFSVARR